jgi:hypothetical protein
MGDREEGSLGRVLVRTADEGGEAEAVKGREGERSRTLAHTQTHDMQRMVIYLFIPTHHP